LQVLYKLWERSWDDDAVLLERDTGRYIEPSRVHAIAHQGEHFKVPGIHLCEPSPQRTPVLFQAGASARGQQFAARHAECVFISGPTPSVLRRYVEGVRQASTAAGRSRDQVLIYAQALLIVAPTHAEAQARFAEYRRYVDLDAALALLSGWTGIDFAGLDPDAPIEYVENDAGRTALAAFTAADPNRRWTVREAAEFVGLGGRGPVLVGDPVEVADQLEQWLDQTGIDGFNLTYAVQPDDLTQVVERVVPELQRRGRYPTAYRDGTLRHKLFGQGDGLPETHVGRQTHIQ
jgi:FMN-dependent oxidoreductase (nitrilotriacetate monooxygenase family)